MKYKVLTATLVAGLIMTAWAGTTIDPSRTLFTGRTMGMGGTHLGFSDDGEGIFANPSGLAKIKYPQMVGVSRKLFLDETTYSILGFAVPTNYGTFGMGYVGSAIGGSLPTVREPGTGRITVDPSLEAMSYANDVILLTYARELPWYGIQLGGNLKLFNQSIAGGGVGARGTAFNLDLSGTYKPLSYLTLGANLQNLLGGSIKWDNSEDKLGGYWKLGGALNLMGPSASESLIKSDHKVNVGLDLDLPHQVMAGSSLFHLGVEYLPLNAIALRAGLNQEVGGTGITFGIGFKQNAFRFDYAYAPRPGIASDTPHYFSLSYVGDTVVSHDRKMKEKVSGIRFLHPGDRHLTTEEAIKVVYEAKAKKVIDQKTTYDVPLISSSFEVKETVEYEDLVDVYKDGVAVNQTGTIETHQNLVLGRNVISVAGLAKPENKQLKGEARVLRFAQIKDMNIEHWAIRPVVLCQTLEIIKGYPDGSFKPEKGITRAELTALLVRTMNFTTAQMEEAKAENLFKDIKKKVWYQEFVNLGSKHGLVQGYPDGTFQPNKVLNRAEGVAIIARFAKLPEKEGIAFPDLKPNFWANKYIVPAQAAGMLNYLKGKDFEFKKEFTRAEAAEVLYYAPPIQRRVDNYWDTGMVSEVGVAVTAEAKVAPTVTAPVITAPATPEVKTLPVTAEAITKPATSEPR